MLEKTAPDYRGTIGEEIKKPQEPILIAEGPTEPGDSPMVIPKPLLDIPGARVEIIKGRHVYFLNGFDPDGDRMKYQDTQKKEKSNEAGMHDR